MFFAPDKVERRCESCGVTEATHEHKLSALPRILILHLKRFVEDKTTGRYHKDSAAVIPDLKLDLAPLTTIDCRGPAPVTPEEEEEDTDAPADEEAALRRIIERSKTDVGGAGRSGEDADLRRAMARSLEKDFELQSFVRHRGSSASTGHYIACVRDQAKKKWIKFNDAISEEQNSIGGNDDSTEGYLFFYESCGLTR
jgi:uncharacterized UBP type Zn finger protein